MKNKQKINIQEKIKKIKDIIEPEKFDPDGSYTGITEDFEKPVQDQDDL